MRCSELFPTPAGQEDEPAAAIKSQRDVLPDMGDGLVDALETRP